MSLRDAAQNVLTAWDRRAPGERMEWQREWADALLGLSEALAAERGEGGERAEIHRLALKRIVDLVRQYQGEAVDLADAVYGVARDALNGSPPPHPAPRESAEGRAAWFLGDGSTVMLPAEEVIRRRKLAARVIDAARDLLKVSGQSPHIGAARTRLQWELDDLDGLLDPEAAPAPSAPPRAPQVPWVSQEGANDKCASCVHDSKPFDAEPCVSCDWVAGFTMWQPASPAPRAPADATRKEE